MENNFKRFLSLLLAFVMVLGMFPVGHVHAAADVDGTTINMNVDDKHEITVPIYDAQVTISQEGVITAETESVPTNTRYTVATTATRPDAEGNLPEGKYVFLNRRMGTALESNPNGNKLWMAAYPSTAEVWTVKAVADGYTVTASNGKYLTIGDGSAGTTDVATTLTFAWNEGGNKDSNYADAWSLCVKNVDEHLCQFGSGTAKVAAGYEEEDDQGAQWDLYAVTPAQEYTWKLADETVTAIEPGSYYIFEAPAATSRNASLVSAQWSDTNAGGGGSSMGLRMENTKGNFNEKNVWKITASATEGKYNVQDLCGWNMFVASGKAMVTPQSHPATVAQGVANAETWQITNDDSVYLHWWGIWNGTPSYTQIAGWSSKDGENSQWNIYKVNPTPVGSTTVTITAVQPGTTTLTIGDVTYTITVNEVHVHNFVGNVTTPANCVDEGVKTFTCECGEGTHTEKIPVDSTNHKTTEIRPAVKPTLTKEGKTEEVYCTACNTSVSGGEVIPQLTMKNAKILDGGEVLALSDCEYVLGGTEGAYSLCHGGTYYVNIRAKSVNCNQTTTASAFLNLDWDDSDGDAVSIWQNTDRTGYLYIHYADAVPKWNVYGSYEANTCDMYLLYADANSTNENIPGYTVADADYVAAHIEEGESYLIAAKNTHGSWFVMVPSVTGNAVGDYIAQVVTDTVTHTHEYTVETVTKAPTCTETGLKDLKCSCGHFHAAEHKNVMIPATGTHTPAEAVKENEVAPTLNSTGSYDLVVRCSVCGTEISREKVTVPALTGAVASVNGTKYATLAEAVEKAADGATVTLLANTNGNGIIIDKDVTIDLGGFTYTIDGVLVGSTDTKSCGFQILSGKTVTIKNGAIVMDEKAVRGHDNQVGNNFVIQNYADLTLEDVAVTGNPKTSYVVSINSGNVAFTGNTSITAKKAGAVAFDVCKYASYAAPTVTVNTTGTIAGNIEVTGGALTLNAGTFTGALTYTAGTVTKAEAVTLAAPADYKWVNGVLTAKTYVAEADGVKYESLAEAVAVGGEVKLLANTNGNGIIIDKNVTIDLNNYTYTIDGVLVGSTGTKSCGFQILSGNTVVIKNGAIVMDENAVRGHDKQVGNNFVIQNYANLTLENVTVTGNSNTSYVVSNNSGNVAFTGNTSITAVKEGAVAFDVCKYASYAEPTVTVAETVVINGKIEAAAQVGNTYYATFEKAVAAGNEITLLADTNGNGIIIDKNITIDLNGKTYTIDGVLVGSTGTKSCGFQILSGKTVTIKNGAIVMDEKAVRGHDNQVGNNFVIQNYADLTLEDVAVTGNPKTSYVVSNNSGNVAFTGNTSITAVKEGAVAFDVCKYASYAEPTVTVDATVVINGKIEAAAQVGNTYYATFEKALASGNEITLLVPVTVTKDTAYDLSGKTIISEGDAFVATSGTLTLNGDGIIKAGVNNDGSWCAVWANGGNVVINGGTYSVGGDSSTTDVNHQNDLIYTKNGGTVTINGGTFLYTEGVWTLNQNDKTGGKIVVYGGTFYKWNPANNNSEGPNTSFVAEGYCSALNAEGNYTVQKHAEAEAVVENNVAPTCGAEGSYDTVVYCTFCKTELSRETTTVPATGKHTPSAPVKEKETATSYDSVVYCSVCDAELSRETVKIPVVEEKITLVGYEAVYGAEVGMRVYLNIPESMSNVKIVMIKDGAWGKVTQEFNVGDMQDIPGKGKCVSIGVASGEMARTISVQVLDADGTALMLYESNGEEYDDIWTGSVAAYVKDMLKSDKSKENKAAAEALLVYGGYAQQYFDVDAETPVYDGVVTPDLSGVTAENLANYATTQTNGNFSVKVVSIEAYLDYSIYHRVYMTVAEGTDIKDYTFKVSGPGRNDVVLTVAYDTASKLYYVDITDIAAAYMDDAFTITISDANGGINVITTCALSWARSVLNYSKDNEQINLAKAMYLYNQAANELFGK